MFTSHSSYSTSKAVNDEKPLSPTQKPRGYGGVVILYSKKMIFTVKQLPVVGNRILAVEVQSSPPLCICCAYMPCRNSKRSTDDYQHFLDQLEKIINTHGTSHSVFIFGDMNASLCHRKR